MISETLAEFFRSPEEDPLTEAIMPSNHVWPPNNATTQSGLAPESHLQKNTMDPGPTNHASTSTAMDVDGELQQKSGSAAPASAVPEHLAMQVELPDRRASSVPLHPPTYTVGGVYDIKMMMHECLTPDGHPEQPARIQRIYETLVEAGLRNRIKWLPIRAAHSYEVQLVHSELHWMKVLALQSKSRHFSRESIFEQAKT